MVVWMKGWAMSLSEMFEHVRGRSGILAVPIGLLGIALTTPARVAVMVCAARSGIGSNAGNWVSGAAPTLVRRRCLQWVGVLADTRSRGTGSRFRVRQNPRHPRAIAAILAVLVAATLSTLGATASAATKTWVGAQAGRFWSNAANWSPSGVPTSTDDVVADGSGNQNMTIDLSVDVASFSVNTGYTSAITVDVSDSLVGYWNLDENTGTTAADSSGNGETASFVNTPTWTTLAAPLNFPNTSALSFNGSNAGVTVTSTAALQLPGDMTVSFWVNRAANLANWTRIVGKGFSPGRTYSVWTGPAIGYTAYFQQYSAAGAVVINLTGTTVLAIGTWYQVTCTVSGNVARIYVNGVLDAIGTRSGTPGTSAEPLTFALAPGQTDFNGRLDDVRIYNRTVSDVEIASLAAGNAPIATVPFRVRGDLALAAASPASFTAPSTTLQLDGRFNHTGTMTFSHNNGTVLLTATAAMAHTFGGSSLNKVIVNDGLIGYWPMDENSGVALSDRSGYDQTGAFGNPPTWTTSSAPLSSSNPSALSFNGTNSFATVPWNSRFDLPGDLTVAFWAYRAAGSSTWTRMVGKGTAANAVNYGVWTGPAIGYKAYFQQYTAAGGVSIDLTGTTPLAIGTWYHIACTVTGNTVRIYINGVLDATGTRTAVPGMSTDPLGIGGYGGSYFNGILDDLRLYNRAIASTEIASLAAGNVPATSIATHTFSDALTTAGDLTIASGAVANGANAITVGGSWLNFGGGSTPGSGIVTLNGTSGAGVLRSGQVHFNNLTFNGIGGAWTMADRLWVDNALTVTNGTLATSTFNINAAGSSAFSGGTFTAGTGNVTLTGATTVSGGTVTLGSGTEALQNTVDVTGGTFTAGSGPATITGAATISGGGIVNGGSSSNLTFGNTLAIGNGSAGTFNANSAAVTFTGAVTLQNGGAFNGNTGSGTFSTAPVLASGTFTVADAGSVGRWTYAQSTTFSSGATLVFPTAGGELSLLPTKTLTLNGPITSSVGTSSTLPKIDCKGCTSGQGITVSFGATSTLNINGLEFDNSVAAGVSVASGATYALFKRLKFLSNVGGAGSTHLVITLGSSLINVPGCTFDTTATHNVELDGTGANASPRAIFEQNASLTGGLEGDAHDLDSDSNNDGVGENLSTGPYYGSVIEWVEASPADTSGVAAGYPTPAFDWNTFTFYGIYAAYSNATGSQDVLWQRKSDGSANYSYSFSSATYGTIVGTPWWDTVNETTAGVDANGNGNQTDTDVRVVYIATSGGYILKLVDNGSSLAFPASGPWSSAVKPSNPAMTATVATISSPLIEDGTNLYFGGTDQSAATRIFGVQISGGTNQATIQRNVSAASAITATPSWATSSGSTHVFLGTTATAGQAYIYRVNMSSGVVDATFSSGVTATVNDSVRFESNNHAYAVTDGGTMHVLDALNFGTGAFKDVTHFPYQTTAASAIKFAPYVDYKTSYAYFGDDAGKLYIVTDVGALLNAGYPFSLGAIKVTSSPVYLPGGGVVAVGANDGYLYFVDRNSGSSVPNIFKRYFVTSAGSISSVSYDYNTSEYMVASSDGRLMFVNGTDVHDPTSLVE
jgi:hypothetical protein